MKLIDANAEALVFAFNRAEKKAFSDILALYPLVPEAHQRLSKTLQGATATEGQRLLDEALAEQRAANKVQIEQWLKSPDRFQNLKSGFTFTISRNDSEWLMQALNDIRVGSWLLLGSPGEQLDPDDVPPDLASIWATMEISGFFQMTLLHALEGRPLE